MVRRLKQLIPMHALQPHPICGLDRMKGFSECSTPISSSRILAQSRKPACPGGVSESLHRQSKDTLGVCTMQEISVNLALFRLVSIAQAINAEPSPDQLQELA